jgi:hypothetical protein
MQTILQILQMAGGWHPGLYLQIDNPPYMELVIEAMDESGPMGLPAVCHYGEQNGDLMRDPEMCFELGMTRVPHLDPWYCRKWALGSYRWCKNCHQAGSQYSSPPIQIHNVRISNSGSKLRIELDENLPREPDPVQLGHTVRPQEYTIFSRFAALVALLALALPVLRAQTGASGTRIRRRCRRPGATVCRDGCVSNSLRRLMLFQVQ